MTDQQALKLDKSTKRMRLNPFFESLSGNTTFQYALLAAITAFALVLRFYKLGEWSFWIDEIFTINRATIHYGNLESITRSLPPNTYWFPISLLLSSGALNIFGIDEWSARLVPAIIGSISIPILYFPVKNMFGRQTALIAVLLLAISPWHIFWSQNARFYTSLILFYFLAAMAFFLYLERRRIKYLILFAVFLYLAISERIIGAFLIPVIISYWMGTRVFLGDQYSRRLDKYFLFLPLAIGLFVLYEVYHVIIESNASFIINFWETFGGKSNHGPLRLSFAIIFQIGIPLVCLGFFGGLKLIFDKNKAGWYVFLGATIPPALLIIMSPFVFTIDRYIFISLPFWIILTAVALKDMMIRLKGNSAFLSLGVVITVLAFSFSQIYLYFDHQNGNRPDWKGAVAQVSEYLAEGDIIAATWPEMVDYYLGSNEIRSINSLSPASIINSDQRVWFLIDESTGWVEPGFYEWIKTNSQLIDVRDVQLPGKSLNILIYLYDPG
jgi:mannosyltransferase